MERHIHKIDLTGKVLGRVATEIALLLRGKNKASFLPYVDAGDIVQVSNVEKMVFTGKKLTDKKYFHHSGYPGGIKSENLKTRLKRKPHDVLIWAVYNMLPKNRTREQIMKRLQFVK